MRDITEELHAWHTAGKPYALASVVAVKGSAPRELGAALAVDADGTVLGSVSGGCVEGAVYELPGARRQVPRLPRHRLRRPAGVRHAAPLP